MRTAALSILGLIGMVGGQVSRCSLSCSDYYPSSEWLLSPRLLPPGASLGQPPHGVTQSNATGKVYRIFGGNATASDGGYYISEAPDSRLFIGRRKFLRVCSNSCSNTQRSALQHQDTLSTSGRDGLALSPSSKPANGIGRSEPKVGGKADTNSLNKLGTQITKKSTVGKHGHDKSSRISHRKV